MAEASPSPLRRRETGEDYKLTSDQGDADCLMCWKKRQGRQWGKLTEFSHVKGKFYRTSQTWADAKGQHLLEKLPHQLPPQFPGQTSWMDCYAEKKKKRERETERQYDSYLPVSGGESPGE